MFTGLRMFIVLCFVFALVIDQALYSYPCEMAESAVLPAYVIIKPVPEKPLVKAAGKNIAITVFPAGKHQIKNTSQK